jgi:hypothetical protein
MKRKAVIAIFYIAFFAIVIYSQHVFANNSKSNKTKRQTGTLWAPYLEWSFKNTSFRGNPFDLRATATFVHTATGKTHTTEMFYDGNNTWKLRFTGTRTGEWQLTTSSTDPDLDGYSEKVTIAPNPDPKITGFLSAKKNKYALQVGENGDLRGYILQVFWGGERYMKSNFTELPTDIRDYGDVRYVTELVRYLLDRGCNTLAIAVNNQWFKAGADGYNEHNSENPDLETFRAVETAIVTAHKLGARVHFWLWGDEQRGWTPIGAGGVNGTPDRRLQRYIAARLGPLPGWTMAYGFDLEEWIDENELREWAEYMHQHLGWPHLLMARNFSNSALNVVSNDNRTEANYYQDAVDVLDSDQNRPHFYERRFLYTRDNWDMENTLQAFWAFAMAGGAGSSWGIFYWANSAPDYTKPEQLRTHAQFWRNRLLLDMERANDLTDGYCLKNRDNSDFVFYRENAQSIRMNLTGMKGTQPVVAIDTKKSYIEIDLGLVSAKDWEWQAPHRSNWAIAIGKFSNTSESDTIPPLPPTGLQVTPVSDSAINR